MFYTINEMARQLGVTTHMLRYYERMGLIEPHTNEKTGYRYYSVKDTRRFNISRMYRAYGMSISECKELLNGGDFSRVVRLLDEQESKMHEEINFKMDKLHTFLFWKPYIENIFEDLGRARVIHLPTVYRVTISHNEKRAEDPALTAYFARWIDRFPVCTWASRIKKEVLKAPERGVFYDYGLIMPEMFFLKYDLYHDSYAERIEGGTYVYTVFRKDTDEPFTLDCMEPTAPFLEKRGLQIVGDGFSNCLYSTKENGEVVNYHYFAMKVGK